MAFATIDCFSEILDVAVDSAVVRGAQLPDVIDVLWPMLRLARAGA